MSEPIMVDLVRFRADLEEAQRGFNAGEGTDTHRALLGEYLAGLFVTLARWEAAEVSR